MRATDDVSRVPGLSSYAKAIPRDAGARRCARSTSSPTLLATRRAERELEDGRLACAAGPTGSRARSRRLDERRDRAHRRELAGDADRRERPPRVHRPDRAGGGNVYAWAVTAQGLGPDRPQPVHRGRRRRRRARRDPRESSASWSRTIHRILLAVHEHNGHAATTGSAKKTPAGVQLRHLRGRAAHRRPGRAGSPTPRSPSRRSRSSSTSSARS